MRLAEPGVAMTSDAGPAPDADATALPAATIAHAADALAIPAAPPSITRADMASLALALLLHGAVLIAVVVPATRLGGGGNDFEALGIDIVMAAPALDSRGNDAERARASAAHAVGAAEGAAASTPAEASADSRAGETGGGGQGGGRAAASRYRRPAVDRAAEAARAGRRRAGHRTAQGCRRETRGRRQPAPMLAEPQADRAANSAPADAATAARDGGAAARGRDDDGMSEATRRRPRRPP